MRRRTGEALLLGGTKKLCPPDPRSLEISTRGGAALNLGGPLGGRGSLIRLPLRSPPTLVAVVALAALLAAPAAEAAGTSITASADRTEMAEDEVLVLTVRIDADEAPASVDLHERDLPFRVLSRSWSTDVSFGIGGGGGVQFRRSRVLTLSLAPARTGDLVIPPVVATVKGVRHATEPIRVKVLKAGGRPRAAPPAPDRSGGAWRGWERDLVLDVEVDRRDVFLGEQVTATVWLLSPVGVVDTEGYAPPLYDGFWVEELERPQRLTHQVRTVNGVPMRAYALQKLALFPTRAGALELGAFQIDVVLRLGSDALFSPFADLRRARRRSAPVELRVKPLPPGAPAGFKGVNVGAWKLDVVASERSVAAGAPVAIRVSAAGEGNIRALALPSLSAVAGARRFEPTATDEIARTGSRLGGSRTLETVLVPEGPGELVVPPVTWPFFDPRSGRYEIARSAELRITVTPSPAAAATPSAAAAPAAAELRPLRAEGALAPRAPPPWSRSPFLAAVAVPPLGFAALVLVDAWRRRAQRGAPARRARGAGRRARQGLRAARRRLDAGDPAAALALVGRALAGYAADRLGRETTGMTRGELAAALAAAGARSAVATALLAALDACDEARFGGARSPEYVLAAAERAIAILEGAPWAPAPERTQ